MQSLLLLHEQERLLLARSDLLERLERAQALRGAKRADRLLSHGVSSVGHYILLDDLL